MPEVAYKDGYDTEEAMYRIPMLRSEMNIMRRDIDTLKNDVAELKRDVTQIKSDITELKHDTRSTQEDISELKSDVKDLRVNVSDLRGEMRTLGAQFYGMEKRIDDIHASHTKWFTLLGLLIAIVPIAIAVIQTLIKG